MYKKIVSLIVCVFICFFSFNIDVLATVCTTTSDCPDEIPVKAASVLCTYQIRTGPDDGKKVTFFRSTNNNINEFMVASFLTDESSHLDPGNGKIYSYVKSDGDGRLELTFDKKKYLYLYTKGYDYGRFRQDFINAYNSGSKCPNLTFCQAKTGEYSFYTVIGDKCNYDEQSYGVYYQNSKPENNYTPGFHVNPNSLEEINYWEKLIYHKFGTFSCSELFGSMDSNGNVIPNDDMINLLGSLVTIVKILIPIVLIVLGSLDLAQSVFAQDDGGIKKAQSKFIKRLIIAVVIFLIPSVLRLLLTIAQSIWPDIISRDFRDFCGILK